MVTRVTHHITGDSFISSDNYSSQENRMWSCDLRRQISVSHKPRITVTMSFPGMLLPETDYLGCYWVNHHLEGCLINTGCLYSPFPFKRGPTNVWVFLFLCLPTYGGFACLSQIIALERLWVFFFFFNLLDLSERRLWHMPLLWSFEDFLRVPLAPKCLLEQCKGIGLLKAHSLLCNHVALPLCQSNLPIESGVSAFACSDMVKGHPEKSTPWEMIEARQGVSWKNLDSHRLSLPAHMILSAMQSSKRHNQAKSHHDHQEEPKAACC